MILIDPVIKRYKSTIRNKAISRAETRIVIAGRKPEDMTPDDLEIVVQEEGDKIKSGIREKACRQHWRYSA